MDNAHPLKKKVSKKKTTQQKKRTDDWVIYKIRKPKSQTLKDPWVHNNVIIGFKDNVIKNTKGCHFTWVSINF